MTDLELYLASALAASVVGNVLFITTLQKANQTIEFMKQNLKELCEYIERLHNEQ